MTINVTADPAVTPAEDTARATRRQVLAAIALAEVPTPHSVSFADAAGVLGIMLDRIADLYPWADLTGVPADKLGRELPGTTYTDGRNGGTRRQASLYPTWLGWRVSLIAAEPVGAPDAPLDDATRAELSEVVLDETVGGAE